jgi:hypothetical protein|eukprot:Stramenopile-MAST_4_protein_2178
MVSRHFSLEDLSYDHEEQVKQYLKFFRSKREVQLKEIDACFEDQRDVMYDEMYSKEDVEKVLSSLCESVRSSVNTDLQNTVSMSMLVLRQLLEEAENEEIEMNIDMTVVEDQSLLTEVNKLAVDAPTRRDRNQKHVKLDGIRDEHQKMMSEFDSVKADNKKLTKANADLSSKLKSSYDVETDLRRELSSMVAQLATAKKKLGESESEGSKMAERGFQSESEMERLRAELEECKALLQSQGIDSDEVRDKSLDRVVQTKQFKEFRRQFQKKNEQIEALRERLSQYEREQDEHDLEIHSEVQGKK